MLVTKPENKKSSLYLLIFTHIVFLIVFLIVYLSPSPELYFQVMAYGNGQRGRQNGRRGTGGQRKHLPPADYAAVKACYHLFKAIHHLILVNSAISGEHNMFSKKVKELNSFFKCSGQASDPLFLTNKDQINKHWRLAHLENIKEHYERTIDSNSEDLQKMKLSKTKLKQFLEAGADWARNSLGRKFSKLDFEKGCEKIYQQSAEQANSGQKTAPTATHTAPTAAKQTNRATTPQRDPPTILNPTPGLTPAEFLNARQLNSNNSQEVPRPNTHRDTANVSTPSVKRAASESPNASPSDEREGKKPHFDQATPPPPPKPPSPSPTPKKDPPPNFEPSPALSNDNEIFPPAQHAASTSSASPENGSRFRVLETQVEPDSFPTLEESLAYKSPPKHTKIPAPKSTPSNTNKRKRTMRKSSPPTPPSETGETTPKRAPQTVVVNSASPTLRSDTGSPNGETQTDFVDTPTKKIQFSTSEKIDAFSPLPKNGVEARGRALQKKWKMPKLTKNTLIVGDENLQRIEKIDDDDVQILSYPGLKFSNLKLLLNARKELVENYKRNPRENENPGTKPEKVVFMVGQHDTSMQASSFHSNLGAIKPLLMNQFGGSQIYFCQVNTPDKEPHILACNKTLDEFCKKQQPHWTFVQCLPDDIFETDPADPTHWTPECAQKAASLIFNRLN